MRRLSRIIASVRQFGDGPNKLEQMKSLHDTLSAENVELKASVSKLVRDIEEAATQRNESDRETDLLLHQLHQVQEELENLFIEHQAAQAEIQTLAEENAKLKNERVHMENENAALGMRCNSLRDDMSEQSRKLDHQIILTTERQECIEAVNEVNGTLVKRNLALESELTTLHKQCELLHREVNTLVEARSEGEKTIAHLREEVSQISKLVQELRLEVELAREAKCKVEDLKQENALLTQQVDKVQEELEQYFLQNQEAQRIVEKAAVRWKKMLNRNPTYSDCQSIQILNVDSNTGDKIEWCLEGLDTAGRHFEKLSFHTVVEHGIAGVLLKGKPGVPAPLLRWPTVATNQTELFLIPAGIRTNVQQRIECLRDLATSDWDWLLNLGTLLFEACAAPERLNAPTDINLQLSRAGLQELINNLKYFPATLRYDSVVLKREQVNPDYEHLWLKFDNLSFNAKHWSHFEFRLSCANVRPNSFGSHPKLEFPEEVSRSGVLDSWYAESYDDFGAKLELRFSIPESMDIEVWQRLSNHDHLFIAALLNRLPAILAFLEGSGVKVKRTWEVWKDVVMDLQRVVNLRASAQTVVAGSNILDLDLPLSAEQAQGERAKHAIRTRPTQSLRKRSVEEVANAEIDIRSPKNRPLSSLLREKARKKSK